MRMTRWKMRRLIIRRKFRIIITCRYLPHTRKGGDTFYNQSRPIIGSFPVSPFDLLDLEARKFTNERACEIRFGLTKDDNGIDHDLSVAILLVLFLPNNLACFAFRALVLLNNLQGFPEDRVSLQL